MSLREDPAPVDDDIAPAPSPRLVGWKRIAAHLNCSERTARRWEREEGLPVHRQVHTSKSTVFALPAELDQWVTSRTTAAPEAPDSIAMMPPAPDGPRAWRVMSLLFGGIGATVAILALLLFWPAAERTPTNDKATLATDPQTADLYTRGIALWQQRGREPNERAIKLLTAAVERDETFAAGWAALASAWATYATYHPDIPPERARDQALMAAQRALQLDATLAEPRTLMAEIAQRNGDWAESQRIFDEALTLDPDNSSIHLWFAGHYREVGQFKRANALTRQALALEPGSPPAQVELAMNHLQGNDVQTGSDMLDHVIDDLGLSTPVTWVGKWFVFDHNEDWESLGAWINQTPFEEAAPVLRAYIAARTGNTDLQQSAEMIAQAAGDTLPPWFTYYLLETMGAPGLALDVAEKAQAAGRFENKVVMFHTDDSAVRQTERFADFVSGLGMTAYWKQMGPPDQCATEAAYPYCRRINQPD
ncbi:hypothetical protein [Parvularcula sp. LCG005]|uniref:tetratricopeptide repeat protein n=1 Tax=Parvularcula sp. LCG005 TaxID=3078805 RepID=UPI002942EE4A|nr:hypothetical protein [Parvularcula sp. LCG005]WOI54211.1 hypothetical protein RUI03_04240 [Parvularcula sp. LCG005]